MPAFLVEDGTGLAAATSYVSVADADDYMSLIPATTAWDALTPDSAKEDYLMFATRVLDNKSDFIGVKTNTDASLRWPRSYVYDRDAVLILNTVVPTEIEHATTELARILLENDITTGQDVDHIKKLMVDVVQIEYQKDTSQLRISNYINSILDPLGWFMTGRRGHGKILRA